MLRTTLPRRPERFSYSGIHSVQEDAPFGFHAGDEIIDRTVASLRACRFQLFGRALDAQHMEAPRGSPQRVRYAAEDFLSPSNAPTIRLLVCSGLAARSLP